MERKSWYMKSKKASSHVQGPFSLEQVVDYIQNPSAKGAVCISPDRIEWHTIDSLFAKRPAPIEMVKEVLSVLAKNIPSTSENGKHNPEEINPSNKIEFSVIDTEEPEEPKRRPESSKKFPIITINPPWEKKVYWGILGLMVTVLLIVIAVRTYNFVVTQRSLASQEEPAHTGENQPAHTGENQPAHTSPAPDDNIDAAKIQEDEAKRAQEEAAKKIQEEAAKRVQEDEAKRAKEEAAKKIQEDEIKRAKEEAAKKIQEDEIKRAKEEGQKNEQLLQARLMSGITDYYNHLQDNASVCAKKRFIREAYTSMDEQSANIRDFLKTKQLQLSDIEKIIDIRLGNKKQAKKDSVQYAYFYPTFLYDECKNFLDYADEKKRSELEGKITEKKSELSQDLINKEKCEKQQVHLIAKKSELESEMRTSDSELQNAKQSLKQKKIEADSLQTRLQRYKSDFRDYSDKIRRLDQDIRDINRQIRNETDPIKKKRLEDQRDTLERDRDNYSARQDSLQSDIDNTESRLNKIKDSMEKAQDEAERQEKKIEECKRALKTLETQQNQTAQNIKMYTTRLEPLEILIKKQKEILASYTKLQKWWTDAYPKPKQNFLLALYVLHHFDTKYYEVKPKSWADIVEVYYW